METVAGVLYTKPQVTLLQQTGIGTSEYAARTCYDSFESSENKYIQSLHKQLELGNTSVDGEIHQVNNLPHSNLLDQLAWTHFHHSILEHANLTYLIKGISRGVLQEHARHRIQSISVRSTRYTLSPVINAFVAEALTNTSNTNPSDWFINTLLAQDLFVTADKAYNTLQIVDIFQKLKYQFHKLGKDEFMHLAVAKSSIDWTTSPIPHPEMSMAQSIFEGLQVGKKKRNVADNFKHTINDNFKADLVVTFNLRSLKNYIDLRANGAAWFQIQWLAKEIIKATPQKYLDLIVKSDKLNKILNET